MVKYVPSRQAVVVVGVDVFCHNGRQPKYQQRQELPSLIIPRARDDDPAQGNTGSHGIHP